jgi:dolichyl-phosphate-mannose--protein O-mannosyl transferase
VKYGSQVRLQHLATRRWLHSHHFSSPLTGNQEVRTPCTQLLLVQGHRHDCSHLVLAAQYGAPQSEGVQQSNWTCICSDF